MTHGEEHHYFEPNTPFSSLTRPSGARPAQAK